MSQKKRTVLVVDSNSQGLENYQQYLLSDSENAYTILSETSAISGLELCQRLHIDVILLEYELPELNGLEFLNQLQALTLETCPPVVMMGNTDNAKIAVKVIKSGAEDYLVKEQTTSDELRLAIDRAIENTNYLKDKIEVALRERESRLNLALEVLRENEERLKIALSTAKLGSWQLDLTNYELYSSSQCKANFGLPPEANLSYSGLFEAIHPDDRAKVLAAVTHAIRNHSDYDTEYRNIWPDGSIHWIIARGRCLYAVDGQPMRMVGVTLDITERKQAEVALIESEERYRQLVELCPEGIIIQSEGKFVFANQAALRFFGAESSEQLLGKFVLDFVHPDYYKLVETRMQQVRENQKVPMVEEKWFRLDGTILDAEVAAIPFIYQSQPAAQVAIRDITERKQGEAERAELLAQAQVARQEAELANRTKDEFLAIVSHELRTPLNAIVGWTKLLQNQQLDEANITRALSTIERNTQVQLQLIEDLLDISRMIRGNLRLTMTSVNLATVLEMAVSNLRPSAESKQLQLQVRIESTTSYVFGDLYRLQQIITNLLSNAIKFTPSGGRVEIQLEQVGSQAQIQVKDTGKGIDPDFLPYIFERFTRADSSTTRAKDGLGLGLAIVRHLVELHNGSISAASPGKGQGATFTVNLPLLPESTASQSEEQENSLCFNSSLDSAKILFVDDDNDTREYISIALTDLGAIVRAVASAKEALEVFDEFVPNIFISDIGMPEEDGYTLLQRVRKLSLGKEVPAIALTAYAKAEDRERSLSLGFAYHINKPVELNELCSKIATLLGRLLKE